MVSALKIDTSLEMMRRDGWSVCIFIVHKKCNLQKNGNNLKHNRKYLHRETELPVVNAIICDSCEFLPWRLHFVRLGKARW